ncbi:MFS transporter [Abyssisolibacter fermentans]|uniref:MFS transporter n=1 Tax=Abyssisolibacter fermentans TaxID=1766203 RepID=UPI0008303DC9|nr:MFS transporter [Abyssisolibacter fermentans]
MNIKIINRDYAYFIYGQMISELGNTIHRVAMIWTVYKIIGSGSKTGLLYGLVIIPGIILMPFAGGIVDSFDRKKLLILCDIASGINILILTILFWRNNLGFFSLLVVLSIQSVVFSLGSTTRSSLIQNIVKKNDYIEANSIHIFVKNFTQIALPSIGGLLIARFNPGICFIINSLTFFIATLFTFEIQNYKFIKKLNQSFIDKIKDGFLYVLDRRYYLNFIFIFMILNFLIAPQEMLVRISLDKLEIGVEYYGMFETALALGSLVISFIISKNKKWKEYSNTSREKKMLCYGIFLIAISFLQFSFTSSTTLLLLGGFINGIGLTTLNVAFFSYLQRSINKDFYGRVISIIFFLNEILRPLSYSFFGYLTDQISMSLIFIIIFIVLCILFALFKNFVQLKNLENTSLEDIDH